MRTEYKSILITILSVILCVTMVACGSVDIGSADLGDDLQSGTVDLGSANIGDYVKFGHYEQNNINLNGKEVIEWKVLDKKDGRALLLSKYGLDAKPYNEEWTDVTWETCTLRSWLNSEFLEEAFSPSERSTIPTVTLSNSDNPHFGTEGGNDTMDQVFLLSLQEVQQYFNLTVTWTDYDGKSWDITGSDIYMGGSRDVIMSPTAYAKAQGVGTLSNSNSHDEKGKKSCCWWLRSPGESSYNAANVDQHGYVSTSGPVVTGELGTVRPALWIDLES